MKNKGFSLIELMVVVVIISILAIVAYPSYMQYQVRTNRGAAMSEMIFIAQQLQSYRVANNSFSGAVLSSGTTPDTGIYRSTVMPRQGTALYNLTLTISADNQSWVLAANPNIAGVNQFGSGVICLNDQGWKFLDLTATATATTCSASLTSTSTWNSQ